jgi:hypothetical protein
LTPYDAADAFTAHDAMCGDFLRAYALVEGPKADRGVVSSRYGFAAVFAEGEGRDGGWVREHLVCALTLMNVSKNINANHNGTVTHQNLHRRTGCTGLRAH